MEVIGQKLSKLSILTKKWQNFGLKWPKFRHIRIFPAYRVWFSQRWPQVYFPYQKLWKFIAAFGRYRPKTLKNGYFGQKWQNFDHFWPFRRSKNFSTEKIFGGHLSHMETQLHAKNYKKILNGQGCRTGTHARTYVRT